jgi:hypothetical protein
MCRESVSKFPTDWLTLLNTREKMALSPRPKLKSPRNTSASRPASRASSPLPSRATSPRHPTLPKQAPVATVSAWAHPSPLPPLPALSLTVSPPSPRNAPPSSVDPLDDFLNEWSAIQKGNAWGGSGGGSHNDQPRKLSEPPSLGGDKREENGDEKWMVKDPSATELRPLRKTLEPIVERVPREPFVDLVSICHCIVEVFGT